MNRFPSSHHIHILFQHSVSLKCGWSVNSYVLTGRMVQNRCAQVSWSPTFRRSPPSAGLAIRPCMAPLSSLLTLSLEWFLITPGIPACSLWQLSNWLSPSSVAGSSPSAAQRLPQPGVVCFLFHLQNPCTLMSAAWHSSSHLYHGGSRDSMGPRGILINVWMNGLKLIHLVLNFSLK